MIDKKSPQDATLVFRASPYALPTAKIGAGIFCDLAFSPFSRVLSKVECASLSEANERFAVSVVKDVRERDCEIVKREGSLQRGILSRGWSLIEIADLLDAWSFENHNPTAEANLLSSFYRPADPSRAQRSGIEARWDPYQVAAYLRYWSNDCAQRGKKPPVMNVGVAFGEYASGQEPFDFPLLNRVITADNDAIGGWTGSSSNWRGDIVFDNPPSNLLDARKNRLEGCDGLLLLHVVHRDARGKSSVGKPRKHHTPFFGICIPAGGPDFLRVVTAAGNQIVQH